MNTGFHFNEICFLECIQFQLDRINKGSISYDYKLRTKTKYNEKQHCSQSWFSAEKIFLVEESNSFEKFNCSQKRIPMIL